MWLIAERNESQVCATTYEDAAQRAADAPADASGVFSLPIFECTSICVQRTGRALTHAGLSWELMTWVGAAAVGLESGMHTPDPSAGYPNTQHPSLLCWLQGVQDWLLKSG